MRAFDFKADSADPIELFDSERASGVSLGHGQGDVHVYAVHFGPNGIIGTHPTGFCQLFLVVQGEGWATGADGTRVQLSPGHGVFFERGESHSKGGDAGMMAIMVQATHLHAGDEA